MCFDVSKASDVGAYLATKLPLKSELFYGLAKFRFLSRREFFSALAEIDAERLQCRLRARPAHTIYRGESDLESLVVWNGDAGDTHMMNILSLALLMARVARARNEEFATTFYDAAMHAYLLYGRFNFHVRDS